MKVKWKCLWNVIKYYLAAAFGAIIVILGVVWLITLYLNSLPSPEWGNINTTNYATNYIATQGCGCGFSTSIIPFFMILIGFICLVYFFYQDIKPCIIWEEK